MRWPFRKREARASLEGGGYTDALVSALVERAGGTVAADPSRLAATEFSASLMARTLSAATVRTASPAIARAISPPMLASLGRAIIRFGQSLFVVEVEDGRLRLDEASTWDVSGLSPDPSRWAFRVERQGPSGSRTAYRTAASVVLVIANAEPGRPWAGQSAISGASSTAGLAASVEKALAGESRIPSARIATMPGDKAQVPGFTDKLRKGGIFAFGESNQAPFTKEKTTDWRPAVMRPEPNESMVLLQESTERAVLAAHGVPVELWTGQGNARDAWRRYVMTVLEPTARLVEAELREKLAPDVKLSFPALGAADIVSKARAVGTLVKAGEELATARELVGLVPEE